MKVLITGSSGFVGQSLVRELSAAGIGGFAVSRQRQSGLPSGWIWVARDDCMQRRVDFSDIPDWVIHLEVKHHTPSPGPAELAEFDEVNCVGTQRWLDWCSSRGVRRFVYFSSIKAIGDAPTVQDETASTEPSTPYGLSKRRGENCVRQWAEADPTRTVLILRPAVIYGPGSTANIASMVRGIDRGYFLLAGRNENVKSLVSLRNVVAAVMHLLAHNVPGVAVYNLVDRESYSVRAITEMVSRQLGRPGAPPTLPLGLARVVAAIGDLFERLTGRSVPLSRARLRALTETTHFSCARLLATGFRHPQATEEGLAELVAWYRAQTSK